MRIALISDIHGNLVAFEAVLADIDRQSVDQIIFLGDAVTLGPQPKEVITLLRSLECPCIMGNHDDFVLHAEQFYRDKHAVAMKEKMAWCVAQLCAADLAYLQGFQAWHQVELDRAQRLLCFHGSPRSFNDFILATTPPDELDAMLAGHAATVMVGGHAHVQMLRRHRETLVVNAGSVGEPFEQMPFVGKPKTLPWAEYAIVHEDNQTIGVELRRVAVDLDAIKDRAAKSDMPHLAEWLQK
ncbi:MAG: metallophosphoesterase family protein [Caldilineaceae bacterium]